MFPKLLLHPNKISLRSTSYYRYQNLTFHNVQVKSEQAEAYPQAHRQTFSSVLRSCKTVVCQSLHSIFFWSKENPLAEAELKLVHKIMCQIKVIEGKEYYVKLSCTNPSYTIILKSQQQRQKVRNVMVCKHKWGLGRVVCEQPYTYLMKIGKLFPIDP